jgi:hypothetical protein
LEEMIMLSDDTANEKINSKSNTGILKSFSTNTATQVEPIFDDLVKSFKIEENVKSYNLTLLIK